ncbi:MAG TPA: lipoyl(octanoyl) transferase LipB [Gemmatimonadales bacterium]|nr:lipoyl(octanoyl) transferase LipB [Gemmatimonadales bacterium]
MGIPDRRGRDVKQVEVLDRGLVPYRDALELQRSLARDRIEGRLDHDVLILLEHPPVVTLGRGSHAEHVLESEGIDVVEVERGGDVTYHGPGQLVGYPIFDLKGFKQDLHWYLRTLEQALIEGLALLDIPAERNPGYTGVWTQGRKIASIGVHVKQWVTWHGFALNVTTDLTAFNRIVPCGIPDVEMTSVLRESGGGSRTLREETSAAMVRGFEAAFDVHALFLDDVPRRFSSTPS